MPDYVRFRKYLEERGLEYEFDTDSEEYVVKEGRLDHTSDTIYKVFTLIAVVPKREARYEFEKAKELIDMGLRINEVF